MYIDPPYPGFFISPYPRNHLPMGFAGPRIWNHLRGVPHLIGFSVVERESCMWATASLADPEAPFRAARLCRACRWLDKLLEIRID